jgi:tRNA (cmo5U34)-methyltransferase
MALVKDQEGTLIHYPSKPDFFDFDSSVAEVFDSMAARSIPMYAEAHRLHAYMTRRFIQAQEKHKKPLRVLDVGASTGGFFEALHREMWIPPAQTIPGLELYAIDTSAPMLEKIAEKLPIVKRYEMDVLELGTLDVRFDIINVSYVLQFLQPDKAVTAVHEMARSCNPGALLLISHKEKIVSGFSDLFQERYIEFRKENGYSDKEIEAKTRALKNSMFPQNNAIIEQILESAGFSQVQETSRWLQFCSMAAIRNS